MGLIFLLKLLYASFQDWRFVVDRGINGLREYTAVNSVLVFATMSITQCVSVVAGIIAMMLPESQLHVVSSLTYVLTGLFIFASSAKTILAGIIAVRRKTVIERIESGKWSIENEGNNP